MNDETQRKLMEWAESGIGKINDITSTEIPALIQEYLNWQFWANIAQIITFSGLTAGLVYIAYLLHKKSKDDSLRGSAQEALIIGSLASAIFSLIVGVATIIATICNTYECVQIKIAPKIYLIEKATDLLK